MGAAMMMQMNPSPSSTPEMSKPMVSAFRMAPVTVLARGASETRMAVAAGMPMKSAEVCSRCLETVMRYHMLAKVNARMTITRFHCARRVLSSSIPSPQLAVAGCGLRAKSIPMHERVAGRYGCFMIAPPKDDSVGGAGRLRPAKPELSCGQIREAGNAPVAAKMWLFPKRHLLTCAYAAAGG